MSGPRLTICDTRRAIIAAPDHILVTGGPGCGKTTVALLKAKAKVPDLRPGQSVLFLSFSRAAVQQIRDRTRDILTRQERERIDVSTYHLFCLRIIEAHGRLLNGQQPKILYPSEERLRKSEDTEGWPAERDRLAAEEGVYAFDTFAPVAASLISRSEAIRQLIASQYPLILLDEFQDTNNDQWNLLQTLAGACQVACLADPDQRIFGYQGNIDPARLEILRRELSPACFDLGEENHRSPRGDILRFANAVLRKEPLPKSKSVRVVRVTPRGDAWAVTPHAAVRWLFSQLRDAGVEDPSVAVLSRTNDSVARLSVVLRRENAYNDRPLPPVQHQIVWDAELSTAAGRVIASIMEWPGLPWRMGATKTLELVEHYFRLKFADKPTKKAAGLAEDFASASVAVQRLERVRKKAPRLLAAAAEQQIAFTGAPLDDWRAARAVVAEIPALAELADASRMLRLFRATDRLAAGFQALWLQQGSYAGAAGWLKRTVERERLMEAERTPRGCVLMNMHKSKGKEFDAVVIVEQPHRWLIASGRGEAESRRLLRVAITRARHRVILTRPFGAPKLAD